MDVHKATDKLAFAAQLADILSDANEAIRLRQTTRYFAAKAAAEGLGVKMPQGAFVRRSGIHVSLVEALRAAETAQDVHEAVEDIGYSNIMVNSYS